jgi:hypothetical protein
MQEWPDDKLDAFFKKLSEEQHPTYDSKNWDQLKKRLDAENGVSIPWWKKPLVKGVSLAIGSLLFLAALWIAFPKKEEKDASSSGVVLRDSLSLGKGQPALASRVPTESASQDKGSSVKEKGQNSGDRSSASSLKNAVPNRLKPVNKLDSFKTRSRQGNIAGGEHIASGVWGTHRTDETSLFAPNEEVKTTYFLSRSSRETQGQSVALGVSPDSSHLTKQKTDTIAMETTANVDSITVAPVMESPTNESATDGTPTSLSGRRWAIRLGAGPDVSAVSLAHPSSPTFTWAAHLDYRLTRHLWIQTGFVNSAKKYNAPSGSYVWPERWKQYILPESVDAVCRMTEIPIHLKYVWDARSKSSTYIALGSTNYQMRKETYDYNYEREDPSIRWYSWEGSTGWYWLSHVHLSVGHERKINDRWRIGIEPFIKVPARKVGFGNVNLYTAGAWVYISYGR